MQVRELPEKFSQAAMLIRKSAESMLQLALVMDQLQVAVDKLVEALPEEDKNAEV